MQLNVLDRIILMSVLPKEGNFKTLKIVRDLQAQLGFSEEELAALKFKDGKEKGQVEWLSEADIPKEVAIGKVAHEIIATTFRFMDKNSKLASSYLSLYEKFVPGDDEEEPA